MRSYMAFLTKKKVNMKQPPRFVTQGKYEKVCKSKKSLYRSKQSPRAWFGRFALIIQEFEFSSAQKDHLVFFHQLQERILLRDVDNIVVVDNNAQGIIYCNNSRQMTLDLCETS